MAAPVQERALMIRWGAGHWSQWLHLLIRPKVLPSIRLPFLCKFVQHVCAMAALYHKICKTTKESAAQETKGWRATIMARAGLVRKKDSSLYI